MIDDLKKRLEELKDINKTKIKYDKRKNNTLLKECMEVLKNHGFILNHEAEFLTYNKFKEILIFTPYGIDWKEENKFKNIIHLQLIPQLKENCTKDNYYIIWGKDLPIINCNIISIINHINDITAVEADTWLISTDYKEIIEFNHEGSITLGQ